jgi:hypothetical protein
MRASQERVFWWIETGTMCVERLAPKRGDEEEGVSKHSADALSAATVVTKRSKTRR